MNVNYGFVLKQGFLKVEKETFLGYAFV